jgi:hypothetical protein
MIIKVDGADRDVQKFATSAEQANQLLDMCVAKLVKGARYEYKIVQLVEHIIHSGGGVVQ